MKNFVLFITLLMVSMGCSQKSTEADKADIEATVKGFYAALEKFDYTSMHNYCTTDFTAFEDGKFFQNLDEIIALVKPFEGIPPKLQMEFVKTDAGKDRGQTILKFKGEFKNDQMLMKLSSFESYDLKKVDGKWLINFFHVSYLPDENDKNYTSIHLLKLPDNYDLTAFKSDMQTMNTAIAKLGYPDCGYSFMNPDPDNEQKYNLVMLGKWKNQEIYKMIHESPEFLKAAQENKSGIDNILKGQVYVKYMMQ